MRRYSLTLILVTALGQFAQAAPRISSTRALPTEFERMALQTIAVPEGTLLLGGYSYADESTLRDLSIIKPDGTEQVLDARMSVDRNHFEIEKLDSGEILVIGGYSESHGSLAAIESIDLATGRVEAWPWLYVPVELFSTIRLPGKVAVIGGLTALGMRNWQTIQIIDLETREVDLNPAYLAVPRYGHESVWIPQIQKALIVGGKHTERGPPGANGQRTDISYAVKKLELWDPATGAVTPAGELTVGRDRPVAHVLPDGKVLIAGGASELPTPGTVKTIEVWDPATLATRVVGEMKVGRMAFGALPYSNKGLIFAGGWVDDVANGDAIEYFDFATRTSEIIGRAATTRAELRMNWVDETTFMLVGGKDNFGSANPHATSLKTVEMFQVTEQEPVSDSFLADWLSRLIAIGGSG